MFKQKLTKIIATQIKLLNYKLVGIEFVKNHILTLRIYSNNKNNTININDCVYVGHYISKLLDKKDQVTASYNLEVSSPGLYRPLFASKQYINFIGAEIYFILHIAVKNRRKWQSITNTVDDRIITVSIGQINEAFELSNIQKANLIPHF